MLGDGGIPKVQEFGKLADRTLAVDQLADDQQAMPVGERLQQFARLIGGTFHDFGINFHTCVYTKLRIYRQELHDGRN